MDMKHCPACGITWEGDLIPIGLYKNNPEMTWKEAIEHAEHYGWTFENEKRFGVNYIGIEYTYDHPAHYDGVSEWKCTVCNARFSRWTGKQLGEGEWAE